jgi:hypothetical protein
MTAEDLFSARIRLSTPAAVATPPFGARVLTARLGRQEGRRWLGRGWSCSAPAAIPPLPPSGGLDFLGLLPNNATFSRFKLILVSWNASISQKYTWMSFTSSP